jgi:hypothetical protein
MQAPTRTDGGTAGSDPQVRPCPGCGADNPPSASFCWQCYRAFSPPAPPSPTWPPAPAGSVDAGRTSGPRFAPLGAIVAVALGVVASIALVALREPEIAFPASIAGLERVVGPQTDAAAASFRTASQANGFEADMAFYGSAAAAPEVSVMWVRGAEESLGGPAAAFDSFTEGLTSGYGGSVVAAERIERTVEGVTYVCSPVVGSVTAGLCMWQDGDVLWMLMDVRPGVTVGGAKDLSIAAHAAMA